MLLMRCAACRKKLWRYDKIGKGEVLRCHKKRIVRDFGICSTDGQKIYCSCGNIIGIDKCSYYKMIDRAFTYAGTKRNV
jgi:phage terminase large subunit-like protein